jgi:hypothetical protein
MSVSRLATVHLIEADPKRRGRLMLYEVTIAIEPESDCELHRGDTRAIRSVVNGCRKIIAGHHTKRAA